MADNRNLVILNHARASAGLQVGFPLSFAYNAVMTAQQQTWTITYKNCSVANQPTAGNWNYIFPFATPLTVSGLAFNETAANLATAINAVLGANAVTCSGGPLNSATVITIAASTGAYNHTDFPLPVFDIDNSTLSGGTPTTAGQPITVGTTLTLIGYTGTGTNSLYLNGVTAAARYGCTTAMILVATNDVASGTWQTAYTGLLNDLLSRGFTKILCKMPFARQSTQNNAYAPDPTDAASEWNFLQYIEAAIAACNNPGACYLGSTQNFALTNQFMDMINMSDYTHPNILNSSGIQAALSVLIGQNDYADLTSMIDGNVQFSRGILSGVTL
jgi:hypothetical protein